MAALAREWERGFREGALISIGPNSSLAFFVFLKVLRTQKESLIFGSGDSGGCLIGMLGRTNFATKDGGPIITAPYFFARAAHQGLGRGGLTFPLLFFFRTKQSPILFFKLE